MLGQAIAKNFPRHGLPRHGIGQCADRRTLHPASIGAFHGTVDGRSQTLQPVWHLDSRSTGHIDKRLGAIFEPLAGSGWLACEKLRDSWIHQRFQFVLFKRRGEWPTNAITDTDKPHTASQAPWRYRWFHPAAAHATPRPHRLRRARPGRDGPYSRALTSMRYGRIQP